MPIQDKLKNKKQMSAKSKKHTPRVIVKRIIAVAEILAKVYSDTSTETHD